MDDKFLIHIEIAGRRYPITIRREEEESMRAAAKQINQKLLQYQTEYGTRYDVRDWLAIVALQLSVSNLQLEEKHDISPIVRKLQEFNEEMERYLNEQ